MLHCTLVIIYLALSSGLAAGQGLLPSGSLPVGASGSSARLQQQYRNSQAWKLSYRLSPRSACSSIKGASLCGAAATNETDAYVQLVLATSPAVYSSLDPEYTHGVAIVNPPGDQQECQTCAAFAVASAAETAMASVLNVSAADCSISIQALYFYPDGRHLMRSCSAGWDLQGAVSALQQLGQSLPTALCLPYRPKYKGVINFSDLCSGCATTSKHSGQGQFAARQIVDMVSAQYYIRRLGSIVTRFDVHSDFKPFFANKSNAKKVYKPGPGAPFEFGHAVVLVGYDNANGYWLAKNSWGPTWADGGYFRVTYGVCSILTPGAEAAWAVLWGPDEWPRWLSLPVRSSPQASCYLYTARPGDYIFLLAEKTGIPLDRFLLDNVNSVKDLNAPLAGMQVLLCNPAAGTIIPIGGDVAQDMQLESLMGIKASIDTTNVLSGWTRESGQGGGYCFWRGVACSNNGKVNGIGMFTDTRVTSLVGTLPAAKAFAGLPALEMLVISDQHGVTGTIPDWSALTGLKMVILFNNGLTGTIPASLGRLVQLTQLALYGNKLKGTIPQELRALKGLEYLNVGSNMLSGTLPGWLGTLSHLQKLGVYGNNFYGDVPRSLANLTNLEYLWVYNNTNLGGCVPKVLQKRLHKVLATFTRDVLFGTQVSGFCGSSIPTSGSSLIAVNVPDPQLESLLKVRAAIDPGDVLSGWNREAGYDGGYCGWRGVVCGPGTKEVIQLKIWTGEGIEGLQGTLPTAVALRDLANLTTLIVWQQPRVHGTLPNDWSTLTQLQIIEISNASLSGSVPSSYGTLGNLTVFLAQACGLKGTLPHSLAHLGKLQHLIVRLNALTGGIPAWLGDLKSL